MLTTNDGTYPLLARPPERNDDADRDGHDPIDPSPESELGAHLSRVGARLQSYLGSRSTPISDQHAFCIGVLHDFGKVTPQFQQYVNPQRHFTGPDSEAFHARLGAIATYYALTELGADDTDALAAFLAVAKHHGVLPNTAEYVFSVATDENDGAPGSYIDAQVAQITAQTSEAATTILAEATQDHVDWSGLADAITSGAVFDALRDSVSKCGVSEHENPFMQGAAQVVAPDLLPQQLYGRVIHIWGTLTFSDKTDAAGLTESESAALQKDHLPLSPLNDHIEALQAETASDLEANLNTLRDDARAEVLRRAEHFETADEQLATLTLPTGLGKTYAAISAAYTMRDEREASPTVVYCLPYTSIIEQTREEFEDNVWGADPTKHRFTVHHYLSETLTTTDTETDTETGSPTTETGTPPAVLLGESWRSGTVLTTFVQLFETLTRASNLQSTKVPSLTGSIIILDEPQALPLDWWPAVRELIRVLLNEFNATIISTTATQPSLITGLPQPTYSLINSPDEYFAEVDRVSYALDESVAWLANESTVGPKTHEAAADQVVSDIMTADQGQSALVVCNTISSCRTMLANVQEAAEETTHTPTNIGDVFETVLHDLDATPAQTDADEVATTVLSRLGFVYDSDAETWQSTNAISDSILVGAFNARYRPFDRRALIKVMDAIATTDVPLTFVTTQAIEAGVDISFSRVYRDIAPLSSIVQATGRCNRSFEWGESGGRSRIWALHDEDAGDDDEYILPAQYVYRTPADHLPMTATVLVDHVGTDDWVSEDRLVHDAVNHYYNQLSSATFGDSELLQHIDNCNWRALREKSLISGGVDTVDVIVPVTTADHELVATAQEAFANGNMSKAHRIVADCADLRVSVSVDDANTALQSLSRVDGRERDADGVAVLVSPNGSAGEYPLGAGGFTATTSVSDRFTV